VKLKEVHLQELETAQTELRGGKCLEVKNKDQEFENHCSFALETAARMAYQLD